MKHLVSSSSLLLQLTDINSQSVLRPIETRYVDLSALLLLLLYDGPFEHGVLGVSRENIGCPEPPMVADGNTCLLSAANEIKLRG